MKTNLQVDPHKLPPLFSGGNLDGGGGVGVTHEKGGVVPVRGREELRDLESAILVADKEPGSVDRLE